MPRKNARPAAKKLRRHLTEKIARPQKSAPTKRIIAIDNGLGMAAIAALFGKLWSR